MNGLTIDDSEVKDLLLPIIKNENIVNPQIKINAGSEKGDNFMSFLKRVDVIGENKELHLMLKCAPRLEKIRGMAPIKVFFAREIFFYEEVTTVFTKFQNESKIERPFSNYPRCFKTISEECAEILVLENITAKGFQLWDRTKRMNEEHLSYIFKNYGKFHAISYALNDQKPEEFKNLAKKMDSVMSASNAKPSELLMSVIAKAENMCNLFKDNEKYYNRLVAFKDGILHFLKSVKSDPGKFPVVAHGDCWCNNMMFKYENPENLGSPTDICLLDFQISQISSPVLDLSYVFLVSASKDILKEYKSYLKLYYDSLRSFYALLGSDVSNLMTFDDLLSEWKIYSKFGFILAQIIIPVMMCAQDETQDLTFVEKENSRLADVFTRNLSNDEAINELIRDLAIFMLENNFI